ncbi:MULTISPECIES: acyltransferase [unclassified Microbacterium]|uniref:acyltransferase family protein n=1 Tax=unclassified Microbacterium TaxID=2609290 RepID=UPI001E4AE3A9|nr:acyltransferase [Microbacterium sp. MAH-37]
MSPSPAARLGRDHAIDLVRALCVTAVVVLHSLMVGVTVTADGPVFANAGDSGWWLVPVSWMLQVMPLFFVVGGFAGLTAYERMPEGSATAFVTARLHRLLLPAVAVIGTAGVGLAALTLAGVPADLVAVAGYRFGQPLWFLAVFLLAQALLPLLVRAHRAAPFVTIGALAGGAVAVDIVRAATGVDAIGFLNLGFVWLAMQQLGFHLADRRIDALSRRARTVIGAVALALLVITFLTGTYSPDLIANINPPTAALILVGVVHTTVFSLLRAPISSFAARPRARAFADFVSQRAMTIYLWHMTVLLALAGASALLASTGMLELPAPASPGWWLGRPVWLALALGITALLSLRLSRIEAIRLPRRTLGAGPVAIAAVLGTAAIALLLVQGTSTTTVIAALTALAGALAIVTPAPSLEVQGVVQRAARIERGPASGALGGHAVLGDAHTVGAHTA